MNRGSSIKLPKNFDGRSKTTPSTRVCEIELQCVTRHLYLHVAHYFGHKNMNNDFRQLIVQCFLGKILMVIVNNRHITAPITLAITTTKLR
jgi:hypothetical protein